MTTATTVNVQFQLRADTAANWTAENPILLANELALETDTKKLKVGDGTTAWASLAYFPSIVTGGTVLGNLEIGSTGTLTFEGATVNDYETTLAVTDPTADRTITLPDVSGTVVTTGDTGSVTSTMLADDTIVNADINASAAIDHSKLATMTAGYVLIGNASNVPTATQVTGDVTISDSGVTAIGSGVIVDADIAANAEIAVSKLANGTVNQVLVTDGTDVSWSDDLTIAGTFRVKGAGTAGVTQAVSFNGSAPVDSLVLTSAGHVGIGTSSPGAALEVHGSSTARFFGGSATDATLAIGSTGAANDAVIIKYDNANDRLQFYNWGSSVSNQNTFVIDNANARVGIGTTAVDTLLHLESSSSFIAISNSADTGEAGILFRRTDNNQNRGYVSYDFTSDALKFRASDNGAGEDVRIDSSGRLLVGTSSARSNVYVGGSISTPSIQFEGDTFQRASLAITRVNGTPYQHFNNGSSGNNVASGNALGAIYFNGYDGTNYRNGASISAEVDGTPGANDMPGRLVFSTTADGASSPTERFRIDNVGRCKVTGGILRVDPSNAANGAYLVFTSNQLQIGNDSAGSTNYVYLAAGGTSWLASSDERQKTNLVPIDDGLNKVGSLRAVTGRYLSDDDGTSRSFLIAQDVQSVLPEAVDSSNPDSLGVSYTDVIPLLVAALKESKERIETLEAKVAALESA